MRLEEVTRETSTSVAEHGVMLTNMSQQVSDLKEQVSEKIDAAFSRVIEKMEAQDKANTERLRAQDEAHRALAGQVQANKDTVDALAKADAERKEAEKKAEEEEKARKSFRREKVYIPAGMLVVGALITKYVIPFIFALLGG